MLRSMTGFGRCFLEDSLCSQVWEIRSVNGKHLDVRWRLALEARPFEAALEKMLKQHASRGRVEVSLTLSFFSLENAPVFNEDLANAMLDTMESFAQSRGEESVTDYSRLLGMSMLWESPQDDIDEALLVSLEKGFLLAELLKVKRWGMI